MKIVRRRSLGVWTSRTVTTLSSPPPIAPSAPRFVSVIPERLTREVSIASSNLTETEVTLMPTPLVDGVVLITFGAKVSSTKLKLSTFERMLLPPVSVALT